MTEPYLILHKVRGQPAFDIAILCEDMGTELDEGPWWIIPTSGHRAYPYWHCLLAQFGCNENDETIVRAYNEPYAVECEPIPDDWPDHCQYDLDRTASIDTSPLTSADVKKALDALLPLYKEAPMVRRKL